MEKLQIDNEFLRMALTGYELEAERLTRKIDGILRAVKATGRSRVAKASTPKPKRHRVSPAGRASIAAAQKKRWAAQKRAAKPKRKTSRKASRQRHRPDSSAESSSASIN